MVQRSDSNTLPIQVLLIALAIQGATPDAHDLSSLRAFQIFGPAPRDASAPAENDGFPDDVCEAIRPGMSLASLECQLLIDLAADIAKSMSSPARPAPHLLSTPWPRCIAELEGLPRWLCRLRC